MDISLEQDVAFVTLSERNIRQLLTAFERGYSSGIVRSCESGIRLYVRVESDTEHYQNREAGPGLNCVLSTSPGKES